MELLQMITFLKANLSSTIATGFDYLLTVLLVSTFNSDPVTASAFGTFGGGVLNFMIGRHWVFRSRDGKVHIQAYRYGLVWAGNFLLNVAGMHLLNKQLGVHYMAAKLCVSLIVGFAYNYTLQKKYVFRQE